MQPTFGTRQRANTGLRRDDPQVEATLIFLPDGTTKLAITGGTDFEGAKDKIEELVATLGADGVVIDIEGEIEKHTHGPDGQSVRVGGNQIKA